MSDLLQGILPKDDSSLVRLMESTPLPMWVFDRATLKFLAVNGAAIQAYGYSREEFLRRTVLDIRPQKDVTRFLQSAVRRPHASVDPEYWVHLRKDNAVIEVEIHSVEATFAGRRVEVVCAIPQAQPEEACPRPEQTNGPSSQKECL